MEIHFPELKMDGWLQVKDLTQDQTIGRRKKMYRKVTSKFKNIVYNGILQKDSK